MKLKYLILFIFIMWTFLLTINCDMIDPNRRYVIVHLNEFELESVNESIAVQQVANQNGYRLHKKVTGFDCVYIFEEDIHIRPETEKRSNLLSKLSSITDKRVLWTDPIVPLIREHRDISKDLLKACWQSITTIGLLATAPFRSTDKLPFNDELWSDQWYLDNSSVEQLGLNVIPVHKRGYTGRDIRIAVLDDGIEYTHDDLYQNYDPEISYDCNNDSPDPHPSMDPNEPIIRSHGTRCAGEIAMVANNKKCGVGVAFNAKIGGIKVLDGPVFDVIEGMGLGYAHDKVDIYTSSWGPKDDGETLGAPGKLASMAIERGINEGRQGRGAIYVWASGNGGSEIDNCNADGYASSIYTITIGSVTEDGTMPWYGEKCPAIMAVTYSSGSSVSEMIVTTDLNNTCTVGHTGTSASAPLAAGIIALGLEANPSLTWRDIQHLIIKTANHNQLLQNPDWQSNSAGLIYNIRFGFGLIDADQFVSAAIDWQLISDQIIENGITLDSDIQLSSIWNKVLVKFLYNGFIERLEHVIVTVNIEYSIRGALEIYLTSPTGTRVQLLGVRPKDRSNQGFRDWQMMSLATWNENPMGLWIMEINDSQAFSNYNRGYVRNCTLTLHGTKI